MTDEITFRRRRQVTIACAVVVLAVASLAVVLLRSDRDANDSASSTSAAPLPMESAQVVIDRLQTQPCTLVAPEEVQQASERPARVNGGGPEQLCTYELLGKPKGDVITAQVSGPMSTGEFELFTTGATKVAGGAPAFWMPGGGTGGRLLARKGNVVVEIGVRLAQVDGLQLQQIGRALIDHALARIPPNRVAGLDSTDPCSLVSTRKVSGVLEADAEALPSVNPTACSFRAGSRFTSVERITGTLPNLHAIGRSTTGPDGKVSKWSRVDISLGDEAVYLGDPSPRSGSGELYVREGKVLLHVVVTGVTNPEGTARSLIDLLGSS